jgi:hypothetical protein
MLQPLNEAQVCFMNAVHSVATRFKINPTDANETIEFNSRQDFIVTIEILQLGSPFVESINAVEPFNGGFVACLADVLCRRAETLAKGMDDGDLADFYSLFELMVEKGQIVVIMSTDGSGVEGAISISEVCSFRLPGVAEMGFRLTLAVKSCDAAHSTTI